MAQTRSYRDPQATDDPRYQETPIGGVLRLTMPEPPTVNSMIALAKKRTRRTRNGGWMKRALPVVYDQHVEAYEEEAMLSLAAGGFYPPPTPWERWGLFRVTYRVHQLRDKVELMAGLKWPIDTLVRRGWLKGDSDKELTEVCIPTQSIDRALRGVDLFLRRDG